MTLPWKTFLSTTVVLLSFLLVFAIPARAAGPTTKPAINPNLPTLFLIGDSTVRNGTKGQMGWGDPIADFFDRSKINVENRALGGRSSRTYLTEGLWQKVLDDLKPGDYVLMQFGHNDGGSMTDGRARASIKGSGDETKDVTLAATGKQETVHTYGWYLKKYVTDAKAKGAHPIVLSLIPRCIWKDPHHVNRATNDYGKWAKEAADATGVPFIDLNGIIADRYDPIGEDQVRALYFAPGEHTHTNPVGAEFNAAAVVHGIRELKDSDLKNYLTDKPDAVPTAPAAEAK